ncbi:hypothetical protein [Actinophytocola xanthii]|uniref:Uncharacterized protein n=1 Tax=Actinophytocola xanthii TaxID=1912961 RepID=A0A1Q8BT82_9PSEU|nr:hypothetical protein [Actinophytocola xanthii]OLF05306.1 hypothetical protein BU204_37225 [Actinophytocola xanthii]
MRPVGGDADHGDVAFRSWVAEGAGVSRTLLARLPAFAGVEGDRVERYRRWLAGMYPGESALNPVRPDRLGEDLVAMTLVDPAGHGGGGQSVIERGQLVRGLTVLGRSASRHAHLRPVMHDLLSASAADRLPVGMAVATQLEDETLISVLTELSENDPDLAELVVDHLPDQSLALAVFAVVRTRAALEHERRKPEPDEETLGWLAVRMAIRLGALEETGEALSYAVDAVQRYQDLTTRDPAFGPDLANALNTLAGAFDAADLPEDALDTADDSVRRLRRLSGNDQELRLILSTALMTKQCAEWARQARGRRVGHRARRTGQQDHDRRSKALDAGGHHRGRPWRSTRKLWHSSGAFSR